MPVHIYTESEVAELTTLAVEAQKLHIEANAALEGAGRLIEQYAWFTFPDRTSPYL